MRRKISASLLAFMLVFQGLSSGYMAPFVAMASEPVVNNNAETSEIAAEPTEAQIEAAKLALEKATKSVNDLFTDSTHKTIKAELVDGVINTAEAAVNALEDEQLEKANLQALITEARAQVATAKAAAIEEEAEKAESAKEEAEKAPAKEEEPATEEAEKAPAKEEEPAKEEAEKAPAKEEEPAKEEAKPAKKAAARAMVAPAVAPTAESLNGIMTDVKLYEYTGDEGGVPTKGNILKELNATAGSKVYTEVAFEIPAGEYSKETTYTTSFKLPSQFGEITQSKVNSLGTKNLDDSFTFTINKSEVLITMKFSEKTISELEDDLYEFNFIGALSLDSSVVNSKTVEETFSFTSSSVSKTITLPIKDAIKPNKVVKKGVKYLDGVANSSNSKTPDGIEWTIDINNEGKTFDTAVITENLPKGLTLVESTLKAESFIADRSGNFNKVDPAGEKVYVSSSKTTEEMTLTLGKITKPTRITFKTTVDGTQQEGKKSYTNTAEFEDIEGEVTVGDIDYGIPLNKWQSGHDNTKNKATWTIVFNENKRNFTTPQKVQDTMENTKDIEIVDVYKDNQRVTSGETVSFSDGEFTFPAGKSVWKVVYTTKYDRVLNNKGLTIKNTATFGSTSIPVTQEIAQGIVTKEGDANFATKQITWTVTVNASGGNLPTGTVITDTYDAKQSLVTPLTGIKLGSASAVSKANGFTITLAEELVGSNSFTYTTKFNPNDLPVSNKFENSVTVVGSGINVSVNKDIPINAQSKDNGTKLGIYNAETREITWTANVNYNFNDLTNASFKDTWSGTQYLVPGSFTVNKLEVEAGQDEVKAGADYTNKVEKTDRANGFDFNFINLVAGEEKFAYQIQYKTKVIPLDVSSNATESTKLLDANYTNKIEYATAGINHVINAKDVRIEEAGNYFAKKGSQVGDLAKWTVDINKSGSFLKGENTITDELDTNQRLNADSLKLYSIYDAEKNISDSSNTKIDGNKITITLNDISVPYVLKYDSIILADDGANIKNTAELSTKTKDSTVKLTEVPVLVKWASFGGSGGIKGNGLLSIKKVGPSGKALEGATFEIYSSTDQTKPLETVTTDKDGIAKTKLNYKFKDYFVKEVKAPKGYTISTDLKNGKIISFKDATAVGLVNQVDLAACTDFTVKLDLTDKDVKRVVVKQDGKTIASSFDAASKTITIDNLAGLDKSKAFTFELVTSDNQKLTVLSSALKFESETKVSTVTCSATIIDSAISGNVPACTTTTVRVTDDLGVNPITKGNVVVYDKAGKIVESKKNTTGEVVFNTYYHEKGYNIFVEIPGYKSIKVDLNSNCEVAVKVELTQACTEIAVTVKADTKLIKGAKVQILDKLTGTAQELNDAKETTLTTDEKGKVIIPVKYATGDYNISIIASGYKHAPKEFSPVNCEFIVDLNSAENSCPTYAIKVVGENGEDIKGSKYDKFRTDSVFTLTSEALNLEIKNVKIDNDGELVVVTGSTLTKIDKAMLQGAEDEYVLTQTETAAGFKTLAPMKIKDLNNCTASVTINFSNTTDPTNPGITCPDFTVNYNGPADSQAEFKVVELVTVDGKETEKVVTENIKVITDGTTKKQTLDFATSSKPITALEDGKYKLVQTKAHPAYDKAADTTFTVVEGVCQAELTVTNELTTCSVDPVITITDKSGKEIPVSQVDKVTVNGKEVTSKIENGKLVIERKDVKQQEKNEVIVTLKGGSSGTVTIPERSVECDFKIIVTNVCDKDPNITITTTDGKEVPASQVEKVTVNGKEVTPTIENGKLVIPRTEVKQEEKNEVTVTLKGGSSGTITIPEFSKDCEFPLVVTNVCDKDPKITLTTVGGKEVPASLVEKVTINGKEVKPTIENGKLVIPRTEVKQEEKNEVTVTLKDGNGGTMTIPEFSKECDFKLEVINVCDKDPKITLTTVGGKEIPASQVEKVTINGKEVKPTIENGKLVIPRTEVKQEEKNEVTVTLKDGNGGTMTIPEFSKDCEFPLVVTNVCDKDPNITITTVGGKEVPASQVETVTVNGKEVKPTIENGKLVIPRTEVKQEEKNEVTVTLKGGSSGTITIPEFSKDCEFPLVVTNVCDKDPKITITTVGGKEVPTSQVEKVTINGKEVKPTIENGKLVIPRTEVKQDSKNEVIVTLKGGSSGTITIPEFSKDCEFPLVVTNVCDKDPKITLTTVGGKEIPASLVEKVTINGKEVKPTIENGKLVIPRTEVKQDSKNEVTVTLKDGNGGTITIPEFSNDCDFTIIVKNACEEAVVKVTLDGKPFKNAEVTVENEKGKVVQTTKSNNEGKVVIKPEFATADHTLFVTVFEETKSFDLDRCVINANFFTEVVVDGDDEEVNNTPDTNVDGDDESNDGENGNQEVPSGNQGLLTYDVYDDNGNLIERNVAAGADGKVDLSHLPPGNYVLVSQDGEKTIKMTVTKEQSEVKDQTEGNALPQTGTQSIWLSTMAGLMLLALGAVLVGRNRKKNA